MESKSNLRDQFCVSYEAHNTPILMKPSGMFGFNNVVTDKNGGLFAAQKHLWILCYPIIKVHYGTINFFTAICSVN